MLVDDQKTFSKLNGTRYLFISLIIACVLSTTIFALNLFIKNFWFSNKQGFWGFYKDSYFDWLRSNFFDSNIPYCKLCFWLSIFYILVSYLFTIYGIFYSLITFISFINWKKVIHSTIQPLSDNLLKADTKKFTDKVAMIVTVCNDFLPNTILQTAKQTYNNMDVWILDDSSNIDSINQIDAFSKAHNFFVYRRPMEHKINHKSKIGNMSAWLQVHGDKYDYVFENDSSSLITSTFVENCLCIFNSIGLDKNKIGGIMTNSFFYGYKNFLSFMNSKTTQFGNFSHLFFYSISDTVYWLAGWGCFYQTSTLKKIPLKEVECTACDAARGIWLARHGYYSIFNPFDFAAKISTQTIDQFKNQVFKWRCADVFMTKSKIYKFRHKIESDILCRINFINAVFLPIISAFLLLFKITVSFMIGEMYFNPTFFIVSLLIWFISTFSILVILIKSDFKLIWLVYFFFNMLLYSYIYHLVYHLVVNCLIHGDKNYSGVTIKKRVNYSIFYSFKKSLWNFLFILLVLTISLWLTYTKTIRHTAFSYQLIELYTLSYFNIWFNLFIPMCLPSFLYVLIELVGRKQINTGYEENMRFYEFYKSDFRYEIITNTDVWKKRHNLIK